MKKKTLSLMVIRRGGQSAAHWLKPRPRRVAVTSAAVAGHCVEMRLITGLPIHAEGSPGHREGPRRRASLAGRRCCPNALVGWRRGQKPPPSARPPCRVWLLHPGPGDTGANKFMHSFQQVYFTAREVNTSQRGNKYFNTVRLSFNSIHIHEASNAGLGRDSKVQLTGAKACRGGQHGDLLGESLPGTAAGERRVLAGSTEWRRDAWRGRKGWSVGQAVRAMPHIRGFGQERGPVWSVLLETPRCGAPGPKRTGGELAGGDRDGPGERDSGLR